LILYYLPAAVSTGENMMSLEEERKTVLITKYELADYNFQIKNF